MFCENHPWKLLSKLFLQKFIFYRFPDGATDSAILRPINPFPKLDTETDSSIDSCIFSGYLKNEPNVAVSLTGGCPNEDSFEVG